MKISEIAALVGGEPTGADAEITRPAALASAGPDALAFVEKAENYAPNAAGCLIVPSDFAGTDGVVTPLIRVRNPKLAFAKASAELLAAPAPEGWVSPDARVAPTASVDGAFIDAFATVGPRTVIGPGARILAGTRIGADCSIGAGTVVHPNSVIYDRVKVGANCILHASCVIGADGFGFVRDGAAGYVKFPQIGGVVIGDEVELGAGTCVDRGALGDTVIGDGTKIDNMVQVAHNVKIGKRVVIASQTGISGSTVIEDDCVIGGQVGFGDHATVRSGAVIGSQAGVLPGKIVREGVWWGTPIQPLEDFKRQNAHVKSLERMKEDLKELKRRMSAVEEED